MLNDHVSYDPSSLLPAFSRLIFSRPIHCTVANIRVFFCPINTHLFSLLPLSTSIHPQKHNQSRHIPIYFPKSHIYTSSMTYNDMYQIHLATFYRGVKKNTFPTANKKKTPSSLPAIVLSKHNKSHNM